MVEMVLGSEAAAADLISTEALFACSRNLAGRLKSVEVSLLLAGRALGFAGPGGAPSALESPRLRERIALAPAGLHFICVPFAYHFIPRRQLLTLGRSERLGYFFEIT